MSYSVFGLFINRLFPGRRRRDGAAFGTLRIKKKIRKKPKTFTPRELRPAPRIRDEITIIIGMLHV